METYRHEPVLAREVVELLRVGEGDKKIIDGTVGCGGHGSLILKGNARAALLGIDRDGEAISRAERELAFASDRVHLERGEFSDLEDVADRKGWLLVDAILLDLGVSSPQIDDPSRGFSHRLDGPLDMRMDKRSPSTACRLLQRSTERELAEIFRDYGDFKWNAARRLATEIVRRRRDEPWERTGQLAALCERVLGSPRSGRLPPATLCFQALRIAVNDELGQLREGLSAGIRRLAPGGRMAVISFHSLEDRIVKRTFRDEAKDCLCPPGLPICQCGHQAELTLITKKPVTAGTDEVERNPRAASAKLRVAEKR